MFRFGFSLGRPEDDDDLSDDAAEVRERALRMLEKALQLHDDGYEADGRKTYRKARDYVIDALEDEEEIENILDELEERWEDER